MTEKELRNQMVAQAEYWLGRKESDMSHRVIIDVYNSIVPLPRGYRMTYYDPWCAAFVSAVAQACNLTKWVFPECGCGPMVELYKKAGRWMERDDYLPDPADVVLYDWQDSGVGDCTGEPDHVGIVVEVDGDIITVIEGNYGDKVAKRKIRRNGVNIRGFGLPDYAAAASAEEVIIEPDDPEKPKPNPDDEENTPATPEEPTEEYTDSFGPLRRGDKWGQVYTAQALLIARGYNCGNRNWRGIERPDGEFGHMTELAVADFQRDRKLPVTGDIDAQTWDYLFTW